MPDTYRAIREDIWKQSNGGQRFPFDEAKRKFHLAAMDGALAPHGSMKHEVWKKSAEACRAAARKAIDRLDAVARKYLDEIDVETLDRLQYGDAHEIRAAQAIIKVLREIGRESGHIGIQGGLLEAAHDAMFSCAASVARYHANKEEEGAA